MLSEAEAQRLRAEVHAAMVARRYDIARAKLQELAQRSRGTWQGPTPATTLVEAAPRTPWEARPRWHPQVVAGLLLSLIVAGVVLVGVASMEGLERLEDHL